MFLLCWVTELNAALYPLERRNEKLGKWYNIIYIFNDFKVKNYQKEKKSNTIHQYLKARSHVSRYKKHPQNIDLNVFSYHYHFEIERARTRAGNRAKLPNITWPLSLYAHSPLRPGFMVNRGDGGVV